MAAKVTAKRVFVSTADMRPIERDSVVLRRNDTPEKRAAKALGVELVGLARDRVLSRTWRVRSPGAEEESAMVIVTDAVSPEERQVFTRMAEDLMAAGDSLPGVLRPRAVTPSRDAYLTDLLTTGSARDLSALRWPPRRRVEFVLQAGRALARLHALGIVHGCLCAGNVLLDDGLGPVLAEVGAVPVHELAGRGVDASLYAAFAAPEVKMGSEPDFRSDVYSLGRVLEDAKASEPNVALGTVIRRATAQSPENRYASVSEMAAVLETIVDQLADVETAEPVEATPRLTQRPTVRPTQRPAVRPTQRPAPSATERPAPRPTQRPEARAAEPRFATPLPEATTRDAAWQPPRALGIAGTAVVIGSIATSALAGGSSSSFRDAAYVALLVGGALVTTLLRPTPATSFGRGLLLQLVLALGCAGVLAVFDPLALAQRVAAQRELHGDEASRRAAVAEIVRLGRDFRGLSLAGLDLSSLDLAGADLRGVDLSGANLTHTKLFAAEVQGASFDGARLAGADLGQVVLGLANLGTAACDAETQLPKDWGCKEGRIGPRMP